MYTKVTALDRCFRRLGFLDPAGPARVNRDVFLGMVALHLLAALACFPWFFSWSGLVCAVVAYFLFGVLGINVGYHRLLTHRGFGCPRWLEHALAVLGVCSLQDSPARWVMVHRLHHQHSDCQPDPHSPLVAWFWGHMGWLLVENRALSRLATYERYARDILQDPFYLRLERGHLWVWVYVAHAALFYLAAGLTSLTLARGDAAFSPWAMGLSFGIGQFLAAAVLYRTLECRDVHA